MFILDIPLAFLGGVIIPVISLMFMSDEKFKTIDEHRQKIKEILKMKK